MTATIQAIREKYDELLGLGEFDPNGVFRTRPRVDSAQAYRLISEIVCSLDEADAEWTEFHSQIADIEPRQVVRELPSGLRDFYESQLDQDRTKLIVSDIANRVRYVREKYLRLINIQPIEQTLGGTLPAEAADRMEIAALLDVLQSQLEDIACFAEAFGGEAAHALQGADTDRYLRGKLLPEREVLRRAIPKEYCELLEQEDENDADAAGGILLLAEMLGRHTGPFSSFWGRQSLADLFNEDPAARARDAASFLGELLCYWKDSPDDFPEEWERRGKRALPLLEELCDSGAVELAGKDFFRPKDWLANLGTLKPIVLRQSHLNDQCMQLLMQVWKSFVFGQWAAVFALSRATLEPCLSGCLPKPLPVVC